MVMMTPVNPVNPINSQVQKLEPGALVQLYELDATLIGGGILRFHSMHAAEIMWQGVEYAPWPINAEGFERTGAQQPAPRVQVGNVDGSISVLCLSFDDMVGTTFIRRRTFEQYLDGQPTADPTAEFAPEVWFVDRKVSETPEVVEFELASVLDFRGLRLPGRQIIANQCTFVYRGDGCAYMGPPVADALDNPTSDPALDRCGKRLSSCRMRLWPDGILNYGAFPAAGLVRT